MLRACPHHGFTELTQVDTFYNGLNENDQDSLNATAGRNLLSKTTREALNIIENKSKVRYSRNKSNVSRMNTTSRESVSKTDKRIDKLADQISTLVEIVSKKVVTPAPVKAVEEICVTCSGPHAWYNCPNTDNNQASVCAATGSYNQVNPPNRVSNQMEPPGFAPMQNNGQNSSHQQSLADDGSETLPPMLERGSYVPWSSRFMRYIDHACKNAKDMWERVRRLIQSTNLIEQERHLRFMKEFDKFTSEVGESLTYWNKYVTNVCLTKKLKDDYYDVLFDHLHQYESIVNASRAKRAVKTHDPLALVVNTYASSSSSRSAHAYYVTRPPSVICYDDYQGEAICDDQEDSLTTTMLLFTHAITQCYSTPTKNRLHTYLNIKNQAIVQANRVDSQSKNVEWSVCEKDN
ncbi:hypothetical protein Tco_0865782 [Tanacetum coccineum]